MLHIRDVPVVNQLWVRVVYTYRCKAASFRYLRRLPRWWYFWLRTTRRRLPAAATWSTPATFSRPNFADLYTEANEFIRGRVDSACCSGWVEARTHVAHRAVCGNFGLGSSDGLPLFLVYNIEHGNGRPYLLAGCGLDVFGNERGVENVCKHVIIFLIKNSPKRRGGRFWGLNLCLESAGVEKPSASGLLGVKTATIDEAGPPPEYTQRHHE